MSTPRSASQGPVQAQHQNGREVKFLESYVPQQVDRRRRKSQNPLSVPDDGFFASASRSALSQLDGYETSRAVEAEAQRSGVSQGIPSQAAVTRSLGAQGKPKPSGAAVVRREGDKRYSDAAGNDDLLFFEDSDNDSARQSKARRRNTSVSNAADDRPQQDVAFFDQLLNGASYAASGADKPASDLSAACFDDPLQQRVSRRRKASHPRQCENPATAELFVPSVDALQPAQSVGQHSCAQSSSSGKPNAITFEAQPQNTKNKQTAQHLEPLLDELDFSSVRFPLTSLKQLGDVRAFLKTNIQRQRAFRRRVLLAAVLSRLGEDGALISQLESVVGTSGDALSLADEPELAVESLICQGRADLALAYAVRSKLAVMDVLAAHIIAQAARVDNLAAGAVNPAEERYNPSDTANTADLRHVCAARQQLLRCARCGFADEQEVTALYQKMLPEKHFLYASALQIAAGFVLEPCARFSDVLALSMWPALTSAQQRAICTDGAGFKPSLELVRFCEVVEFAHFAASEDGTALRRPRSLNAYDLQALPFCPFLLEQKLALFAYSDAQYSALCIRQLKLILQNLSTKKTVVKEGALRKSQLVKFVAFSSQEAHDWATTQGQQLYNARNGDFGAGAPADSEQAGIFDVEAYLQASERKTVGQRLGDALTAGLGKLLGTGVE